MLLTLMLLISDVPKLPTIDTSNYSYNMSRFAAAGQAVSNEALLAFNAVHASSPDYAALQKSSMKNEQAKRIAANKAEGELYKQAIKSVGTLKTNAIEIDSKLNSLEKDIKQRMAGKLAAMGGLVAKAAIKPREVERPSPVTTDYSGKKTSAQKSIEEAQAELDAFNNSTKPTDGSDSNNTSDTPSQSAFSGDPSIFRTGDTGRSTGPHLDFRVWSISKRDYVDPHDHLHHVTAPGGGSLVDSYPQTSPYLEDRGSYVHQGIDYGIPEGTELNVNLPFTDSYWDNSGGGNMSIYQLPDPDLELVLMHGQGSKK